MRTKRVAELPKCDFCPQPAEYDAPTKMGPWANMCKDCWDEKHNGTMGTKFVKGIAVPAPMTVGSLVKPLLARRISEEEVKCPKCGEVRLMEPDARSTFNCEGCGIKLHCMDCMEDTKWMEEEVGLEGAF